MLINRTATLSWSVTLLLAAAGLSAQTRVQWGDPSFSQTARSIARGERLRVDGLRLRADEPPQGLDLERIQVFAKNARVSVHGEDGVEVLPTPRNTYFRGQLSGDPRSRVFLTVLEDGSVRGLASGAGRYWLLGDDPSVPDAVLVREVDAENELQSLPGSFSCEAGQLTTPTGLLQEAFERSLVASETTNPHTVTVAIETDHEFFLKFGNANAATSYIGDLIGFASGVYDDELNTNMVVGDISLWSTSGDPWEQTGSACGLLEFGKYWNENNGGVSRTIAHFMSGKGGGSGIAWVGVLCTGAFGTSQAQVGATCSGLPSSGSMGGAYGFTKGLSGNFNPQTANVVWDIVAITHEIGHNFNSPHTHCYEGIGGNPSAVDQCWNAQSGSACFSGTESLPSGCPGAGQGCGTIMSYCHLSFGGSLSNIALSLGRDFTYGTAPSRVPDRMRSHVESVATFNPSCLERYGLIHSDGFESSNTSNWSSAVQ